MSARVCLAALLLAVLGAAEAFNCADITPLADLNVTQLNGHWVVAEVAWFRDGAPAPPPPPGPLGVPRCVSSELRSREGSQVKLVSTSQLDEEEAVVRTSTWGVDPGHPGHWTIRSNVPDRQNLENLVLAADPGKYLATLRCQGQVPRSLVLYSRRTRRPSELSSEESEEQQVDLATSAADLADLRGDLGRTLGVDLTFTAPQTFDCYFREKVAKFFRVKRDLFD